MQFFDQLNTQGLLHFSIDYVHMEWCSVITLKKK